MREILFRGKRTDTGEWVEGFYSCKPCILGYEHIITSYEEIKREPVISTICYQTHYNDVIPETVGQYTGLTDRNGKKIFEGDIVKNEYEKGHYQYFKIFYCNRTYMWQGANKYGMLSKVYQMLGTLEVIGNIHDNPALLEGNK